MLVRIDAGNAGRRIDQILADHCHDYSRARIQQYIKTGYCTIDDKIFLQPSMKAQEGQTIVFNPPPPQTIIRAEAGSIDIIYEDENIAIINKPPGLTVHPCPSCQEHTLAHRLLANFPSLANMAGDRPGIVHRLDKDTSGLMIIALSENARLKLISDFSNGKIKKEYLALVYGVPPEKGTCQKPIGRDPVQKTRMAIVAENHGGKAAKTQWEKIWQAPDDSFALLKIRIFTGRTHQIRVHMAYLGFPVLGDQVYAPKRVRQMAKRQMLHAWKLALNHPASKKGMLFMAKPPEDMQKCVADNVPGQFIIVTGNQGCGKSTFCDALAEKGIPIISADAIVSDMYAKPGIISDWLKRSGHEEVLTKEETIDKNSLMELLERDQALRKDFESYIHSEVFEKIIQFVKIKRENGERLICAEIPLYFEADGSARLGEKALIIGIDCPKSIRFDRLRENRGWNQDKISAIENWQMPEQKKMKLCDIVIGNSSNSEELRKKAFDLIDNLNRQVYKFSLSNQ